MLFSFSLFTGPLLVASEDCCNDWCWFSFSTEDATGTVTVPDDDDWVGSRVASLRLLPDWFGTSLLSSTTSTSLLSWSVTFSSSISGPSSYVVNPISYKLAGM